MTKFLSSPLPVRICAVAAILLNFFRVSAQADYRLDAGDVLEISVSSVQDFKRRTTINDDGEVSLPFLGNVQAAGLSLATLRLKLRDLLVTKDAIRDPDITIELVEHRPFYMNGDVSRPGAYPYRPRITVRQAIALSGGYDAMRLKVDNPVLATAELRSQYESLWVEFALREARFKALSAELDGRTEIDLKQLDDAPLSRRVISEIADLESRQLKERRVDQLKEKDFLKRSIRLADDQIASLQQEQQQTEQAARAQSEGLATISAFNNKGLVPITRITDERASLALVRGRQLEAGSRLARARQDREDFTRKLEKTDDDRRMKVLQDLQEATSALEKTRTQLQATGEKLLYTSAIKSQLLKNGVNEREIAIYRRVNGKLERSVATEDSEVDPGDVVDVLIKPAYLMTSPDAPD